MRRPGRTRHLPPLARAWFRPGNEEDPDIIVQAIAPIVLGRLRIVLPLFRGGAAGPFHRRLPGREQRAPAAHVFPARRRIAQRRLEAGPPCLESGLRDERTAALRPRRGTGCPPRATGNGATLARN